ncbi:hypothetical protein XENTR_v10014471 [Xenopus tropicalis]|uniref:Lysosomal-associated membrane protein 3 n=1 Tax=Xenopus tropicalis TaxID=8364 RepID=A0A6I8RJ38_XENTR|nr:lysosome-associated membrane glycoprotein 3 [Xenopus tropicalis]KAE8603809.1 hypothetical protein XENTR_v10014471 [Xenopus tropicalis]|eukprot:XP_002936919.2 PREDICTED: lysosome-associated membrane glycoprotein 3 [Xenopus tropicalis]
MDRVSLLSTILLLYGLLYINDAYSENTFAQPSNTTTPAPNTTTTHVTSNTTTLAPNTTTTHVTSNTTTLAPNTTTTHITSNTTTLAPNTTTTLAPNTTTTHSVTTTKTASTTTPTPTLEPKPSPPETGNYTVKIKNEFCIEALMGLELELTNSTKTQQYFNIVPSQINSNGTCEKSKANLNLTFANSYINFVFAQDDNSYYLDNVTVYFNLTRSESWYGNATNQKLLKTENGYSVKCKNTPKIQLGDTMNLVMTNVKLQVFNFKDNSFGKETTCKYDHNFGLMIAGIVIVVIVVLGVIIYFIWHKRKSSGYQRI